MKKNNSVNLAIALSFLIVSLFVSMVLVRQTQELRRKAADGGEMYLSPTKIEFKKGEKNGYELRIKNLSKKFDGIYIKDNFCYDSSLIEFDSIVKSSVLSEATKIRISGSSEKCLEILIASEARDELLPKGEGELLATIYFKALTKTGNGSIRMFTDEAKLLMTGPEGTFTLSKATGADYTVIDDGTTVTPPKDKKYKRTTGTCDKSIGEYACTEDPSGPYSTELNCKTDATCFITYGHSSASCNAETGDWNCTKDTGSAMTESQCKADVGCDTTHKFKRGECDTSVGRYLCSQDDTSGTFSSKSECEVDTATCKVDTTARYKRSSCDTSIGQYNCSKDTAGSYTSLDSCKMGDSGCVKEGTVTNTPTPRPTATNTPTPTPGGVTSTPVPTATATPVPGSGGYMLKFKMVYPGLAKGSAIDACMSDLFKVKMIVMAVLDSGATQTITVDDVVLSRTSETVVREDTGNKAEVYVFKGQVALPDSFPYNSKLAVFIDSKKHLTIKYGTDKQTGMYKKMYGDLGGLTKSVSTTPEFDFTGYPPLAGDINGDDVVNVLDFTELKAAMNSTDSRYYGADFTGDCMINSVDSAYFFASLKYKEGQIY